MEIKEWLTTQEAADRLGVSTARIRQMVAENQITARKMGGKYRGQWQIKSIDVEKRLHEKGVTQTMRVKNRMTPNPIVASLETNYNEALHLMKKNKINHLPIVDDKGRPIGIVTTGGMLRATPSPVTTLNVYEIASLLENVTMGSIMVSPVLAVDESCSITNAANFMLQNKIDSLLITRDGILVGIITAADIFRTFVEITGGVQPGTRIEAKLPNQKGHLAPFIQALSNAGSYIVAVTLSNNEDEYGFWDVKERGGDEGEMRKELDKLGYVEVLSFRQSDSDKLLRLGKE
ncbi:MAG: CBS domain-containing protein [Chloroflexi bacterium]|nr:CBS domain-containing protein [Chloroflexota bacterium]